MSDIWIVQLNNLDTWRHMQIVGYLEPWVFATHGLWRLGIYRLKIDGNLFVIRFTMLNHIVGISMVILSFQCGNWSFFPKTLIWLWLCGKNSLRVKVYGCVLLSIFSIIYFLFGLNEMRQDKLYRNQINDYKNNPPL